MVTITRTNTDNTTDNIVILDTTEDAETFLSGLAGRYWGIPGFKAKLSPTGDHLTVSAAVVGGGWRTLSTYTTKDLPDA